VGPRAILDAAKVKNVVQPLRKKHNKKNMKATNKIAFKWNWDKNLH
jgi:hypothetical protein